MIVTISVIYCNKIELSLLYLKVTWRIDGRKSDPNGELAAAAATAAFSSCAALRLAINLAVEDVGWKILHSQKDP